MVSFRPHHYLCTYCFQGEGYSPAFLNNYKKIIKSIKQDELIVTTKGVDDICQCCPHRKADICTDQALVTGIDEAHQACFKWSTEKAITWCDAKSHIEQTLDANRFEQICRGCPWQSGICQDKIHSLNDMRHVPSAGVS